MEGVETTTVGIICAEAGAQKNPPSKHTAPIFDRKARILPAPAKRVLRLGKEERTGEPAGFAATREEVREITKTHFSGLPEGEPGGPHGSWSYEIWWCQQQNRMPQLRRSRAHTGPTTSALHFGDFGGNRRSLRNLVTLVATTFVVCKS